MKAGAKGHAPNYGRAGRDRELWSNPVAGFSARVRRRDRSPLQSSTLSSHYFPLGAPHWPRASKGCRVEVCEQLFKRPIQIHSPNSLPCRAPPPPASSQPAIYVCHLFKQMTDSRFRSVRITLICGFNFCLGAECTESTLCSIILHSTLSPLLYPF